MIRTGVQQIMLGTKCGRYDKALATLKAVKDAGYEGIELNSFMIHKTSFLVKAMTRAAGMPVGNGGGLDWQALIRESGLAVLSLHTDLGALERDAAAVAAEAKSFGTDFAVVTGMYRFDYGERAQVVELASRLNRAGEALKREGLRLLYHNHNVELQKVEPGRTAYDLLLAETDPAFCNFEFDSYWMTDGGANIPALMEKLGARMRLWHINDRGAAQKGPFMTPILKEDSRELGYGNMDLDALAAIAEADGVEAVILESHRNWVDGDPVRSLQLSADYMMRFHN